MRKVLVLLPLLALGAAGAALAGPWDASFRPVGTISTTAPTSGNRNVPAGGYIKLQCDVAAYVGQGAGSGTTCSASTCQRLAAGDLFYVKLLPSEDYVTALAVAGTATCQVFYAAGQ